MMPPRPVSPMKPRTGALLHPGSITEEEPTDNEKLLEAQDEIAYLKDENADLKARIAELEDEQLTYLKNGASTSESDKDARIAQLVQENQELVVVLKNADVESDLRKQEAKMRREQDKRYEVEQRLIKEVEFERNVSVDLAGFFLDTGQRTDTRFSILDSALKRWSITSSASCSRKLTFSPVVETRISAASSDLAVACLGHLMEACCPLWANRPPTWRKTAAKSLVSSNSFLKMPGSRFRRARPCCLFRLLWIA